MNMNKIITAFALIAVILASACSDDEPKDAIKEKFGARWLPAKAKNSDFPGNWWIIETKHNVADVLAVIQQYA